MKAIRTVTTVVRSIQPAGDDLLLFELADPENWELPPFKAGNHIDLHLPEALVRSYSLCGNPAESQRYYVAIKREDAGRGGSVSAHALRVGDVIQVSLPRGTFLLAEQAHEHVFIAGGIGITPFVAMAAQLERNAATAAASADGKSIKPAAATYVLHVLHRGARPLEALCRVLLPPANVIYHQTGNGQPRPDLSTLVGKPGAGRHVYSCGPDTLMDAVVDASAGWEKSQVHIEHFVPPERPVDPDARPYEVELTLSKKTIAVLPNGSLLAALREHGVEVDAACEGGICGACRVRWLAGQPVHHDRVLSDAERAREVIVCVSGCKSSRLVLEI